MGLDFFSYQNKSWYFKYRINNSKYHSYNSLGLIYIIKNNLEKAYDNLSKAGFNVKFPYAHNNLGLFYQLYLNQTEKAENIYKRASENYFALFEFNLGNLREQEGKIIDAINHYNNASKYENNPFIFNNKKYQDKRLEKAKPLLICYAKIKLVYYYLKSKDYKKSKEYFIMLFSKILTYHNFFNFPIEFNEDESKKEITSYIRKIIIDIPILQIANQQNMNDPNIKNYSYNNTRVLNQNSTTYKCHSVLNNKVNNYNKYNKVNKTKKLIGQSNKVIFENL